MLYKYRFVFYAVLILIFGTAFGLLFLTLSQNNDPINYSSDKKELNRVFSVFEGKVYAMVPSNGDYEVKGANPSAFKTIPGDYADAHIGYDDHFVYAGNLILKGLKPDKLKILGNNYYTDGETTYYCARNSETNKSLGAVSYIIQIAGYGLGWADKPQNYWYPFIELPKNEIYKSRPGFATAANDHQAFYKGLELPNGDPVNIRPVKIKYWDGDIRDSEDYRTDGKRVYYQNQVLPLAYNAGLYEIGIESDLPSRSAYLIDNENGMVYADGHSFDKSKVPYQLISNHLEHANQAIFAAKDGLYFYNSESQKMERAGDNPFPKNQFDEIAPDVFSSDNHIYFLTATEHWGRKTGLQSRSTHLLQLENVNASGLSKISKDNLSYGSLWQSGSRYFYFDDLGTSQLMPSAIYEVKDLNFIKNLLNSADLTSDDIRRMNVSGKLIPADGQEIAEATTPFDNDLYPPYWIVFAIVGVSLLVVFILRNKKIDPYQLKDGYFIINNLIFTKYLISDIDKIVFKVDRSYRGGGYSGFMQVFLKNGKISRNVVLSTKVTLLPESETTVEIYIKALQKQLNEAGIRNVFTPLRKVSRL